MLALFNLLTWIQTVISQATLAGRPMDPDWFFFKAFSEFMIDVLLLIVSIAS